ncbi:cation:proton antiporter [Clostridium tarantellae]|uniref:Cation:proton antiporter n=1 Tax=Clostridium tarantellae TaxID=39493 RepID=A0A6I1MJQ2_9CLOT|nr:cation:proton antiporter [Clostridium tarantellae]MPQ43174.1 cation:proton antiporter [Clostridium tarantellae]
MNALFYIGTILLSGLIVGKIASFLKFPKVTGYLIAGIIIGPSMLNIIPKDTVANLGIISQVALALIAYGIGSELNFQQLSKMGSKIIIITIFEAFTAVFLVDFVFIFILKQDIAFSMILGSIAAATAPASTIMVLKQYRARGPLVDTLLPVVAIDDVMAVVALGVSLALSKNIMGISSNNVNLLALIGPFIEIIQAILLGIMLGFILSIVCSKRKSVEGILCITLSFILIGIGITTFFNISTLLTSISIGATIANLSSNKNKLFEVMDNITPPIFLVFFTLSGSELELQALTAVGFIGGAYIALRIVGKVLGAFIGAKVTAANKNVQKYLGMTLLPQAGVAIGLVVVASTALPEYGEIIRAIILSATVIYELIGPLLTKIAILKAGEAKIKVA